MNTQQRLEKICQQLEGWRGTLRTKVNLFDEEAPVPQVRVLLVEAKELIRSELGDGSVYEQDIKTTWPGYGGRSRNPNDAELAEIVLLLKAASRAIANRVASRQTAVQAIAPPPPFYVDEVLIQQIKSLPATRFDFKRLAELCRELNVAAAGEAHMAIAMILRSIIDHVPPALGNSRKFSEVANSYGGTVSFKKHMKRFEHQLRDVADGHLHTLIRPRESLPLFVEVDFRSSIGELLREIVRVNGT